MAPVGIDPHVTTTQVINSRDTISTGCFSGTNYTVRKPIKKETRQQKLDRISLAKHRALMRVFNERYPKIIDVKQVCKPQYRICY